MRRYLGYAGVLLAFVLVINYALPLILQAWAQLPAFSFQSATCPYSTSITSTGETALATTPGLTTAGARTVSIQGQAIIQAPTGTSTLALKIRRGSGTTGANVITPTLVSATANAIAGYSFAWDDSPGEVAGQQYTLTVSPTGAGGAGTAFTCQITIEAH